MIRNIPENRRPQLHLLELAALYTRRFKDHLKITLLPTRFAIHNITSINSRLLQKSNTNHNIPILGQYNHVSPTAEVMSSWRFRVGLRTCDPITIKKDTLSREKCSDANKYARDILDLNHTTCILCSTKSLSIISHHNHVPLSHDYTHRHILTQPTFTLYYRSSRSTDSQSADREKRCGGKK